jgi:hypothetical protein
MEKGELTDTRRGRRQDMHGTLAVFWGNQLERIKQHAEGLGNRTCTDSQADERFPLGPGESDRD